MSIVKSKNTKSIIENLIPSDLKANENKMTRLELYNLAKNSGLSSFNNEPLLKYPKGSKRYWKDVWRAAKPRVKTVFQAIEDFKKEQKSSKKTAPKRILTFVDNILNDGSRYSGLIEYTASFQVSDNTFDIVGTIDAQGMNKTEILQFAQDDAVAKETNGILVNVEINKILNNIFF